MRYSTLTATPKETFIETLIETLFETPIETLIYSSLDKEPSPCGLNTRLWHSRI